MKNIRLVFNSKVRIKFSESIEGSFQLDGLFIFNVVMYFSIVLLTRNQKIIAFFKNKYLKSYSILKLFISYLIVMKFELYFFVCFIC